MSSDPIDVEPAELTAFSWAVRARAAVLRVAGPDWICTRSTLSGSAIAAALDALDNVAVGAATAVADAVEATGLKTERSQQTFAQTDTGAGATVEAAGFG